MNPRPDQLPRAVHGRGLRVPVALLKLLDRLGVDCFFDSGLTPEYDFRVMEQVFEV